MDLQLPNVDNWKQWFLSRSELFITKMDGAAMQITYTPKEVNVAQQSVLSTTMSIIPCNKSIPININFLKAWEIYTWKASLRQG